MTVEISGLSAECRHDRLVIIGSATDGHTQTVCVPFQLLATAVDVDGAVTNLAVRLDGAAIASGIGTPLSPTVGLDFPGAYTFTARADDNAGGTSWATQAVRLAAYPLHWIIPGGVMENTNGVWRFSDTGATDHPWRFYRAEQLP